MLRTRLFLPVAGGYQSPQEIAALLGVPVEAVTAVTDQAQPQNHGGSEQQLETGEF